MAAGAAGAAGTARTSGERRPRGLIAGAAALLASCTALSAAGPATAAPPGTFPVAGTAVTGGHSARTAATIGLGRSRDTIGPGQTRWYRIALDASATADLAVTAVPEPGAATGYGDGIDVALTTASGDPCGTGTAPFGQDAAAAPLTAAVSRVPSDDGTDPCDKAGPYLLAVHRTTGDGSGRARWPLALLASTEPPLPAGTTPAAARTDYGTAPVPAAGTPRDTAGGSGFDDAARIGAGVWRDRLRPGRTRWYKLHLGWGQQLTYAAQFANAPALGGHADTYVTTGAYAPGRLPVADASAGAAGGTAHAYDGTPVTAGLGTVPVTWTNRWTDDATSQPVHQAGDYWIAVTLGPVTSGQDTSVGVVLRVEVTGTELAGPQYKAPPLAGPAGAHAASTASPAAGDSRGSPSPAAGDPRRPHGTSGRTRQAASPGGRLPGGLHGADLVAFGVGGALALAGMTATALLHRARTRTDRSRA
jgi:Ca-activated chloride channel family protein